MTTQKYRLTPSYGMSSWQVEYFDLKINYTDLDKEKEALIFNVSAFLVMNSKSGTNYHAI